ncbi:sulfotransferase family 2 domain-containing protein [Synechococcus sp. CC9616]|uniref:sulfotransferase family 2 domain-containing protein n=1 Tax=Synechococcus sp. CC9616 TaxID=110663 RepID=UPI00048CB9B4|nr:sulfotransferase family 2 domain-containing protein [Synechococcus sp. CC9616]
MIIDHSLRLVFLHVPKCAGTNLRQAFLEAAEGRDVVSLFDFSFSQVLQRQVDLAHLPLMDLRHFPEWRFLKRYRVIACIRHPYERLASACREYLRQKSRNTEMQVRSHPPSREQLLAYLRRLPDALEAHDLRYVHGFPITWFTHYGEAAMVDHLLHCDQLANSVAELNANLNLPTSLKGQLERIAAGEGRRPAADLVELTQDPDLRAMAHLLHRDDFRTFGFDRTPAAFTDSELGERMQACQAISESHALPLTSLTPQMRWYYGRSSTRHDRVLTATRRRGGR